MNNNYIFIHPPHIKLSGDFTDDIITIVCRVCKIPRDRVLSPEVSGLVTKARHLSAHFARLYTNITYKELTGYIPRNLASLHRADLSVRARIEQRDRTIFSLYINCMEDINSLINTLYPIDSKNHIAGLWPGHTQRITA